MKYNISPPPRVIIDDIIMSSSLTTTDPSQLKDAELLHLSLQEPRLFEELVRRYQRSFIRKATVILGDEDDANDVVQEVFVRIYTSAPRFEKREAGTFKSWAYTILIHQCYSAYRKKYRHEPVSLDADPELAEIIPDQAGLEEVEKSYSREYILRLVSKLPDLLRRAVVHYFIEGRPQKEIAAHEGVSTGVIRARIHRAKGELRKLDLEAVKVTNT